MTPLSSALSTSHGWSSRPQSSPSSSRPPSYSRTARSTTATPTVPIMPATVEPIRQRFLVAPRTPVPTIATPTTTPPDHRKRQSVVELDDLLNDLSDAEISVPLRDPKRLKSSLTESRPTEPAQPPTEHQCDERNTTPPLTQLTPEDDPKKRRVRFADPIDDRHSCAEKKEENETERMLINLCEESPTLSIQTQQHDDIISSSPVLAQPPTAWTDMEMNSVRPTVSTVIESQPLSQPPPLSPIPQQQTILLSSASRESVPIPESSSPPITTKTSVRLRRRRPRRAFTLVDDNTPPFATAAITPLPIPVPPPVHHLSSSTPPQRVISDESTRHTFATVLQRLATLIEQNPPDLSDRLHRVLSSLL